MSRFPLRAWRSILLLFLVCLIPFMTSAIRTRWVLTQTPETLDNPEFLHFLQQPLPILAHMIGGSLFCLIAIAQFTPEGRMLLGPWHRRLGRIAVFAGFIAALSGVWMVLFYPHNSMTDPAMAYGRLLFGILMACAIVLAMVAIGRRHLIQHRAWMFRAFGIATAGATQGILIMGHNAFTGILTAQSIAIWAWVGWIINLIVVELLIRRANHQAPYPARPAQLS